MAGAPSSFSTQLCTTCSSCALAQVGSFHCAQVVILHFVFCFLHFVFCFLHFVFCFFVQVDVFHHLENINLLITIVIIISALMMINNRVLIVNYSQGTLEIHGQVNICASVWRFIFNMFNVSYLEIIVIYDNYFVCLFWSLYQTPVRPLRLEWCDSGWWRQRWPYLFVCPSRRKFT